ncbi:MAG: hypothetical protein HN403_00795 [Rhodospirillales bacterium]|jgi:hypothetical protein|nr:hypothetical protein [Rhodospirillales bacterium]
MRNRVASIIFFCVVVGMVSGCVTTPFPRAKSAAVSPKKVGNDVGSLLTASRTLDSGRGAKLLLSKGFMNPIDDGLRKRISSRTIFIGDAAIYFTSKGEAIIDDRSGAKKLKSKGKWTIQGGRVCYSVRAGHKFCTGVFVRKDETLCWPGMGTWEDDTGFLSRCVIYKGNGTKGKRPAVAHLAKTPAAVKKPAGRRQQLAGQLTSVRLAELSTGNTLKIGRSLIHYGHGGIVQARDFSYAKPMGSRGTWRVKGDRLCHSVGRGHEFCLSQSEARDGGLTCRPDFAGGGDPGEFAKPCVWMSGDATAGASSRVLASAAANTGATQAVDLLTFWHYQAVGGGELSSSLTGNTLIMGATRLYFEPGGSVRIVDRTMGRRLGSSGNWLVSSNGLCHSVRTGHRFCTGVFRYGSDYICQPGSNKTADGASSFRECSIVRGDQSG